MTEEKEINLVGGFYPKEPKVDFIKCSIGINRKEFVEWFKQQDKEQEWINIDIKVSKKGNWYAAVNDWKPKPKDNAQAEGDDVNIPF